MPSSFAQGQLRTYGLRAVQGQWQLEQPEQAPEDLSSLLQAAATSGRLQVSDIVVGAADDPSLRVMLAVPLGGTEQQRQVAVLTTTPEHLLHALSRHGDSNRSVILAITDGQGRILERSVDSARFIGKPVPDWQTLQAQGSDSGSFTAQTLEGHPIVFAFQHMEGTPGWVSVVGESAQSFNQRSQQPIRVMLVASVVTIALALLLALLLVRKTLQPIQLLASRARRIATDPQRNGQRLMADVPASFVAEFEVLRQSLDQADAVLQQSLEESRAATQQAQDHLSVLQAAEKQARLGHWSMDSATGAWTWPLGSCNVQKCCRCCLAMLTSRSPCLPETCACGWKPAALSVCKRR